MGYRYGELDICLMKWYIETYFLVLDGFICGDHVYVHATQKDPTVLECITILVLTTMAI